MSQDAQHPTAQPWTAPPAARPSIGEQERTWATLSYAVPVVILVATVGTLGLPAAVISFLVFKDRGSFVRACAANSLNVQIMAALGLFLSAILFVVLVGYVSYLVILALTLGIGIIGLIRANRGESWTPPFTPRLVR
jgi:hypothetical protein